MDHRQDVRLRSVPSAPVTITCFKDRISNGFLPTVLWQEWCILGRCPRLRGCCGERVEASSLSTSERWTSGLSIQKRWESERKRWLRGLLPPRCLITAAVSIFTGGNGSVDRVSYFLLGGSDRTESQENM